MGRKAIVAGVLVLTCCACSQQKSQKQATHNASTQNNVSNETLSEAGNTPRPRASLPEPNGPIDPKSVEAAGQVVQSYGALIEQRRWTEANALWGDGAAAAKMQSQLSPNDQVHLEIGNLGEPEGAAGSIYVSMPVIFYGENKDGQPLRRSAEVILRRINDVPGSTEAQRRWHIERIDWDEATKDS